MDEIESLVGRAAAADGPPAERLAAFGEIVRRYQDMAYGCAYAVLGDFHLAEDAAQEAFLAAYADLPKLRTPRALPGWLRRIVIRQCSRLTRRKRVATTSLVAAAGVASGEAQPPEAIERRELAERVLAAIRALPERQRMVTALYYIDGYSQKDIAEFLEVPVTTVKKRLHDSRSRLKRRMLPMVDRTLKSHPLPDRFADVVVQWQYVVERIDPLAARMRALSDEQLAAAGAALRRAPAGGTDRDGARAEAFALVREAARRTKGQAHYDVQLIAAVFLDAGWIAEEPSGEGKSLTILPAAYLAAIEGRSVHVVTVNDYLARRDAAFAADVLGPLGATVGHLSADMPPADRRRAYGCDITYGTAVEFGFDWLRDITAAGGGEGVQGPLDLAIVDEADSVLIDDPAVRLVLAEGFEEAPEAPPAPPADLRRDVDYLVEDGKVVLVDASIGRGLTGRRWADGVHQAVERAEGVAVSPRPRARAAASLGEHFGRYRKLAGLAGTARGVANELRRAYSLDVVAVPTRRCCHRVDHAESVFDDAERMAQAVVGEVRHYSRELGRPVLVAAASIAESEALADLLSRHGIAGELLNARADRAAREGEIVAGMGLRHPDGSGAVTVATCMAGRGTDVQLGEDVLCRTCRVPDRRRLAELGVPGEELFGPGAVKCCIDCADYDEASGCAGCFKPKLDARFPDEGRSACRREPPCGLHVLGVGRHADGRIDEQLRLRAGRQGQPGSSRWFRLAGVVTAAAAPAGSERPVVEIVRTV